MTTLRILVADDYTPFRETVVQVLAGAGRGWVVDQARDGQEVLSMAERLLPDLILMDVAMPHLSGFEATRALRRKHPEVKVIVLLPTASPEYERAVQECGAQAFVAKECIAEELVRLITLCTVAADANVQNNRQKGQVESRLLGIDTPKTLRKGIQEGLGTSPKGELALGGLFVTVRDGRGKERTMRTQRLNLVGWALVGLIAALPFVAMFIMYLVGAVIPVELFLAMGGLHYAAVILMIIALGEKLPGEATDAMDQRASPAVSEPDLKDTVPPT